MNLDLNLILTVDGKKILELPISEEAAPALNGVRIPAGAWVYGTAAINGDRLQVHVRSVRDGRNLYTTDLIVYDLDGLPGVHIPDVLSQDVASGIALISDTEEMQKS